MESWRVCLTWLDSNYRRKTWANYVDNEEDENDDYDYDWSLYVWLYIFYTPSHSFHNSMHGLCVESCWIENTCNNT